MPAFSPPVQPPVQLPVAASFFLHFRRPPRSPPVQPEQPLSRSFRRLMMPAFSPPLQPPVQPVQVETTTGAGAQESALFLKKKSGAWVPVDKAINTIALNMDVFSKGDKGTATGGNQGVPQTAQNTTTTALTGKEGPSITQGKDWKRAVNGSNGINLPVVWPFRRRRQEASLKWVFWGVWIVPCRLAQIPDDGSCAGIP